MENPRAVVVVPAYNEEVNVGPFLTKLVKIKNEHPELVSRIILVNDGSRDRTGKIARGFKPDVEVVTHLLNMGKARAFYSGLLRARRGKHKVMITLDADLKDVTPKHLAALARPLGNAPKGPKIMMSIGNASETPRDICGERAFLLEGLDKLVTSRGLRRALLGNWRGRRGYGLEFFLNWCFSGSHTIPRDFVSPTRRMAFSEGPTFLQGKSTIGREFGSKRYRDLLNELRRVHGFFREREKQRLGRK